MKLVNYELRLYKVIELIFLAYLFFYFLSLFL